MLTELDTKTKKATAHLHDMKVAAVRLVGKGANGRTGILLAKSADEPPADDIPVPLRGSEPVTFIAKAVELREAETLEQYLSALRLEFDEFTNKAKIDGKWWWIRDVYDDHLVAASPSDEPSKAGLFSFDYMRATGGTFIFAEPVEVKVAYVPVATATQKNEPAPQAEVENPAPAVEPPAAPPGSTQEFLEAALGKSVAPGSGAPPPPPSPAHAALTRLQVAFPTWREALVNEPHAPDAAPLTKSDPAARIAELERQVAELSKSKTIPERGHSTAPSTAVVVPRATSDEDAWGWSHGDFVAEVLRKQHTGAR